MSINTWIGIDPSLTSTGICIINSTKTQYLNFRTGTKLTGWHKRFSHIVEYFNFEQLKEAKTFSQNELQKLNLYDNVTDLIIANLLAYTEPESCQICIENFSYQSRVGPLIDLVSFSTALKLKLLANRFANLEVLAPAELKSKACQTAYGKPVKGPSRNNEGIAGGHFKKSHMMMALFDAGLKDSFIDILYKEKSQLELKLNLVKPIDDLVDARWLAELAKKVSNI